MSLITKINDVSNDISAVLRIEENKNAFEELQSKISRLNVIFVTLQDCYKWINQYKLVSHTEDIKKWLKFINQISQECYGFTVDRNFDLAALDYVDKEVFKLKKEIENSWKSFYISEAKQIVEILNLFKNAGMADAEPLLIEIQRFKSFNLKNNCQSRSFMEAINRAMQIINFSDIKDNVHVKSFIVKLSNHKATLKDAMSVYGWIKENRLEEKLKVNF